jgi:hypothetical protein
MAYSNYTSPNKPISKKFKTDAEKLIDSLMPTKYREILMKGGASSINSGLISPNCMSRVETP